MADVVEVAALESSTSGVRGLSSRVDKSGGDSDMRCLRDA